MSYIILKWKSIERLSELTVTRTAKTTAIIFILTDQRMLLLNRIIKALRSILLA